jgi:hypothetical protein
MIRPIFSWNDFFSGSPQTTLSSVTYNSRQNPTVTSVHVLNCLFNRINSGSDGGALYCTSATYFLVESSSFFTCKTSSSKGGAIYISNAAQCVLYRVCGNDCCSTYTGRTDYQFAYMSVVDSVLSKNYVNYSSISRCFNTNSGSYFTIQTDYGIIRGLSVNSSINRCHYSPGFRTRASVSSNSVTCSLLYSSFADNRIFTYICVFYEREGTNNEMKYCNVLRNIHDTSSYGTIYTYGNLMIEGSCILGNTASCIFYENNPSYSITLSNSTVDKTTSAGSFRIQNTVRKSFILGLNHISTQNCHSEFDSVGTLSAIPYVPSPTKKEIYSCNRNHILARISDFFILDWVFIVTFIQPNPSVDY